MPSDVHQKVYCLPKFSSGNYHALMKSIYNLHSFESSDVAKYRHHILKFFYEYGLKATLAAFEVKQSTLYDWKRSYETSGKKLSSLVPKSTTPHHTRQMVIDSQLAACIKSLRKDYGNLGKEKIKPFVDAFAKEQGVLSYGATKIGKIIKHRHYYFEGKHKSRSKGKPCLGTRTKYAPKESQPGYIQMDSVTVYIAGRRYSFSCAIDIVTKFAHCGVVPSLKARYARATLEEFRQRYGQSVRVVQTDNGSEFLGDFHEYLEEQHIPHVFSYPHSPKVNGTVERFNRTIQEEFINRSDELYYDLPTFKEKLTGYLSWYNTQRPHHSLKLQSPLQYLQQFI